MSSESDLAEVLTEAVTTTFSEMAFIDIAAVPGSAETTEEPDESAFSHILSVAFTEPEAGKIALYLPYACKRQIVENIYGSDWQTLSSTEIDDCLLEILNVLAGNFLNRWYAREGRVGMSFPELLFDDHRIHNLAKRKEYCFDAEGNEFKIALVL